MVVSYIPALATDYAHHTFTLFTVKSQNTDIEHRQRINMLHFSVVYKSLYSFAPAADVRPSPSTTDDFSRRARCSVDSTAAGSCAYMAHAKTTKGENNSRTAYCSDDVSC